MKELEKIPYHRPIVLLLTDAEGEEKRELIGNLSSSVLIKQVSEDFIEEMEITKKQLGFDLDPLHLEIMGCVCAQTFIGTKFSTFSKRVKALRKLGC